MNLSFILDYTVCKETIFSANYFGTSNNNIYVNSVINTSDERLVCVVGALFSHLKEVLPELTDYHISDLKINSISTMSL